MSLERKLHREKAKKAKKQAEKEMAVKIALFDKLPDECLTCEEPFDKKNKEMAITWNVVVREEEKTVRLYCPTCWKKAIKILEDFKEHLKKKNEK
jgi:predicted RNA-binding Zn-ribbon protein involved in translation (DUF1610 family)